MRDGDDTPVSGGGPTPSGILRTDLPSLPEGDDELSSHLMRLMILHPKLEVNFRADDIPSLKVEDKLILLEDFNRVLGIKGFNLT